MATPTSWNIVTSADSNEVVIAADFPATGRPEAQFTDLAPLLGDSRSFWQTVPPVVSPEDAVSGADYIARWGAELADSGLVVRGVLGFCVGGVYAAALADEAARRQERPPVLVLFDPEQATVPTLYWQFEKLLGNLATVLSAEEITRVRDTSLALMQEHGEDVGGYAAGLHRVFRSVAVDAFGRLGLDAERTEEMIGLFSSFISYLSVAARLDVRDTWRRATAVSSSSPRSGLNADRSPEGGDSPLVAREIRFDTEHAQLLRSDAVAATVRELLQK
ncbi:hypothetical protein [Streptomyces luteireticuli]|uniref:Thioesterase domain-containing protein n=1 Tax=Streptomyces luteireticuli TaxID=173858 RepID=A0ABN0YMZ8_9ACTN